MITKKILENISRDLCSTYDRLQEEDHIGVAYYLGFIGAGINELLERLSNEENQRHGC